MLATNTTQTTSSPKPTKKSSWKTMATVLGLVLFFTGAMVAILIVQKQNTAGQPAVPVAPTAPVSEPSAAIDPDPAACALGFTVVDEKADLTCTSKVAYTSFLQTSLLGAAQTTDFPAPLTTILPNTEFVYVITLTSSGPSTEDALITDVLPATVTYVGGNQADRQLISYDPDTRKVTANLGKFPAAGTRRLQFKVKSAATLTAPIANTAKLSANSTAKETSCPANSLAVTQPGTLSCASKTAFTNFTTIKADKGEPIPAGGMITAGKEFVYAITITASAATQKDAVISDVLPTGVIWVGKEPGDKQIISYDSATRTVSSNIGTFSADALTRTIEFKVKTATDIAVGKFTNTAKVQFDGDVAATAKACDATLEIPPQGTAGCEKRAITNFTSKGGVGVANAIVQPGNVFVYQIKVLADKQTSGAVKLIDTLPAGIEFMEDPDNTAGLILSADKKSISLAMGTLGTSATNKTTIVEFKVKVASNATGTLVNSAAVTTGSTTPYKCEQSLVIQTVGSPATPAATPAPGCNDVCKVNADCSNSAHICYTTSNGTGRCRLDTNPTNESCSAPVAGTPSVPATPGQPAQPTLPAELPQTGAEDWGTWLKAGLVTLGAGAILLLLL